MSCFVVFIYLKKWSEVDMKKQIYFVILCICMLSLSACGSEKKGGVPVENVVGYCEQSIFLKQSRELANAPEGYYGVNGFGDGMYLTYISKSSAKQTYLCSKPECSHVADERGVHGLETCDAYIGCVLPASIVYHNGYVYVLRYDRATYDVTLVKISADGSMHEDIMVVGQCEEQASYYSYVFADDETIFMVYNPGDYTGEERTINLDKIDLNKKEKTTVYQYATQGAHIMHLRVLGDQVFFTQAQHLDKKYIYQLMRYDIKEERTETVLQEHIDAYTLGDHGELYYFIARDGLYRCDLKTMDSKKLRECDEETMYVKLAYDGTYLYMDNLDNRYDYNEESEHNIFVCDLEGSLINSIHADPLYLELTDPNYIVIKTFSDQGTGWSYIKKTDITKKDVTWTRIER